MNTPSAPAVTPEDIDLLIRPEWIIPIEPAGVTLSGHALAVRDGRILALLPDEEAMQRFRPQQTLDLPGQVLLPGLVNLHTHAAMSLLRGYADDLPLMRWLGERIWPAESRHAGPDFVRAGTLLACAEMVRGGITTFNDMYFFPDAAAQAARQIGMRAVLGIVVIEFPTRYAADADDYLAKGLAIRDASNDDPLLSFCLAPHAPYTVADKTFRTIATLAGQLEIPVHVHLHETCHEIEESLKQHGVRPIERLHRLGLLGPQLIAVHAVHLDAAEIDLLAREACHVAHCPTSNLKLGSGIAPMSAMQSRGLNFGLGTDGAASNNRLDLFHEMRHAALLAKGASQDAEVLDAHRTLEAATLGGARALGLDRRIGSLLPGKAADLCAVRLDEWLIQPCFDPASHLVYVAGREQVSHTWVEGKLVMSNGVPTQIGISELLDVAGLWHTRLTS
ncbi:MAG: cytosine deaminase [Rhodocyclaceae bacterium]|nr:MAG: cytosine deaminase [Rhodocyclaceae bacterium]TND05383.1 MAG: cytosine deaminase [Rhodocyclaceae bacterium]